MFFLFSLPGSGATNGGSSGTTTMMVPEPLRIVALDPDSENHYLTYHLFLKNRAPVREKKK